MNGVTWRSTRTDRLWPYATLFRASYAVGESDGFGSWLTAHGTDRGWCILRSQYGRDVAGRESELGKLIRLQPYAHGVVSRAEQARVADPGHTFEFVDHKIGRAHV